MEICNYCGIETDLQQQTESGIVICQECSLKLEGRSIGLGDTIAKFTHVTGLDVVAKEVANTLGYEDCGCDERKKKMNELFPYIWPKYKK